MGRGWMGFTSHKAGLGLKAYMGPRANSWPHIARCPVKDTGEAVLEDTSYMEVLYVYVKTLLIFVIRPE